jgi:hypothetical protein
LALVITEGYPAAVPLLKQAVSAFDESQAAAELPTLRAIASADLHNLVFRRDYRIIPAIVRGWAPRQPA